MTDIPAMMLWTDAYMGDTSHLTTTEHGAYLLILMSMWRNGGSLPDDDVRLARTARLALDKWRKIAPTIREFMTASDGTLTQKRLKLELEIASGKREKLSAAGASGGRAKALKNKKTDHSVASQSPQAMNKQPEPESETDKLRSSVRGARGKPKTRILADAQPTEVDRRIASENDMDAPTFRHEWAQFRDRHIALGTAMADWSAGWRTWVRNWISFGSKPIGVNGNHARAGPHQKPATMNPFLMGLMDEPDDPPQPANHPSRDLRTIDH